MIQNQINSEKSVYLRNSADFSFIFAIYILPSLINKPPEKPMESLALNLFQIIYILSAVFLIFWRFSRLKTPEAASVSESAPVSETTVCGAENASSTITAAHSTSKAKVLKIIILSFSALMLLLLNQVIWQKAFLHFAAQTLQQNLSRPAFSAGLFFSMAVSALFEESVYRMFLPFQLRNLKAPRPVAEILPVILFAAGHRTSGIFSVMNALFAALILRVLFVQISKLFAEEKNGAFFAVLCGTLIHFSYNALTLLFIFFS